MIDKIFGSEKPRPKDSHCYELLKYDNPTHQNALAYCDCLIRQYLDWKMKNHRKSNLAQYTALILTATTPVILLIPWENYVHVTFFAAAASAVAAIATGVLAISGWRENYIRYGYVWHALQTEKCLFLTHATEEYADSDREKAARNFARRIEQVVIAEVTEWRALMQDNQQRNRNGGAGGSSSTTSED